MRKRVHIALAILLVAVTGVVGWQVLQVLREREPLMGASGRKPSPNQAQAFTAALFELHRQWTTNGNDVIFSRARWPASRKALKVNGLEVNHFWARASRREDGPWGWTIQDGNHRCEALARAGAATYDAFLGKPKRKKPIDEF